MGGGGGGTRRLNGTKGPRCSSPKVAGLKKKPGRRLNAAAERTHAAAQSFIQVRQSRPVWAKKSASPPPPPSAPLRWRPERGEAGRRGAEGSPLKWKLGWVEVRQLCFLAQETLCWCRWGGGGGCCPPASPSARPHTNHGSLSRGGSDGTFCLHSALVFVIAGCSSRIQESIFVG